MLKTLVCARPSRVTPALRHYYHSDGTKHKLVELHKKLAILESMRKSCREALQPLKVRAGMELYYEKKIQECDKQIPTLQDRIEELKKQLQTVQTAPKKNNPQIMLAQLEHQMVDLRNKRQQIRDSGESTASYNEKIQSLEKRIQSL